MWATMIRRSDRVAADPPHFTRHLRNTYVHASGWLHATGEEWKCRTSALRKGWVDRCASASISQDNIDPQLSIGLTFTAGQIYPAPGQPATPKESASLEPSAAMFWRSVLGLLATSAILRGGVAPCPVPGYQRRKQISGCGWVRRH
jgi:hypothetical protein